MKRCPACQRTYTEPSLYFCLDDGTVLVNAAGGPQAQSPTAGNLPQARGAPTEVLGSAPSRGDYGSPMASPPYTPPYGPPLARKRNLMPWFAVGALVLIAAVVGIILATRDSGSATAGGGPTPSPSRAKRAHDGSGVTYDSPDGRFSITLPPGFKPFTSQNQTQATPAGPLELVLLQSETPTGACVMGYSDFPEASFEGRTPKKMLEDGRDGSLSKMNATLEKQEDLTVQGRTGLAVYGSGTSGGRAYYVRFHFILDKPRAYQIGYLAYNRADLDKPDVEAYFDSFLMK